MKQTRTIFITALLAILSFGTVIYTSCRKDRCKNLNCQNGGTCQDGFCICPTGYTGTYCQNANVSNISLRNQTFTAVKVTVDGTTYTVDSGDAIVFTAGYGDSLKATARTRGLYGVNVELPVISLKFPTRNTLTYDLDVPSDYFFLMATNINPTVPEVSLTYVNYKQRDSTLDVVISPTPIKNNGDIYHIGYYRAYNDTKVRLEKTPLYWQYDTLHLPGTKNQSYIAVVH